MTMKLEGDSGRTALDDAFAGVAAEVVDLAAMVPTPAAVAHAARAQEGLRKLRLAAMLAQWNSRTVEERESAHREVSEQLMRDVHDLSGRLAISVLGLDVADIVITHATTEPHGARLVRVLTRDNGTLGVRFDRTWAHTFVDRVTCLLCEGSRTEPCDACGATGGESIARCVPCRGRGIVACSCARAVA